MIAQSRGAARLLKRDPKGHADHRPPESAPSRAGAAGSRPMLSPAVAWNPDVACEAASRRSGIYSPSGRCRSAASLRGAGARLGRRQTGVSCQSGTGPAFPEKSHQRDKSAGRQYPHQSSVPSGRFVFTPGRHSSVRTSCPPRRRMPFPLSRIGGGGATASLHRLQRDFLRMLAS